MKAKKMTVPNAAMLASTAKIANTLSPPLTVVPCPEDERGAGAVGPVTAERCAVGGAMATRVPGAPEVGGVGGFGPVPGAATGAAADAVCGAGAPVGSVGNLIVGEAVGFGGKLMRTVSFLG